jgi:hypothetical protein
MLPNFVGEIGTKFHRLKRFLLRQIDNLIQKEASQKLKRKPSRPSFIDF